MIAEFLNNCIKHVQYRLAQPCLLCGASTRGKLLCGSCQADLPRLPEARCPQCALPTHAGAICGACLKAPPHFEATRAVFQYAFPLDAMLHRFKYAGLLPVAGFLARCLHDEVKAVDDIDLIIPMPLHARRMRERGFNQVVEIGRQLVSELDIPMHKTACIRVQDRPPQASLPLDARRQNIRGAFACSVDLTGKRVALLDDVMTTGASLNELARTVRTAGATRVEAWVVARTLPRRSS